MKQVKKLGKCIAMASGIVALLMVALAVTDIPYFAYHRLGTHCQRLKENPEVIVVLGGSGMPSPDGLIRTYYGAEAASKHAGAKIIIAHPQEENGKTHQLNLMAQELIIRGVDSTRIIYEPNGHNTYSQAVNVSKLLAQDLINAPILIITTPEHMFRSIRSFQKAGLTHVGGLPSFEIPISPGKLRGKKKKGKQEVGLSWRYNFWSYLRYEIIVLREYCAIAYYKANGWI